MIALNRSKIVPFLIKIFPYYKWSVYTLLGVNMLLYAFFEGNYDAAIENLTWIVLLLLFEWETSQMDKPYVSALEKYGLRVFVLICYVVILISAIDYSSDRYIERYGTLDAWNAWTWLLVVALLEYDVYAPGLYSRIEWILRNGAKAILYSALITYAVLWGFREDILNFWDAFLWIMCFFSIEMNVLKYEEEQPYEDEVPALDECRVN